MSILFVISLCFASIFSKPSTLAGPRSHGRFHPFDPTVERLGFCDQATVSHLSYAQGHYDALEEGMHRMGCWSYEVRRLYTLLAREEEGKGEQIAPHGPGASQGHRLRCRILLAYDTCLNVYQRHRHEENQAYQEYEEGAEGGEWPAAVLDAINSQ